MEGQNENITLLELLLHIFLSLMENTTAVYGNFGGS